MFYDRLRAARIFRGYTLQRSADAVGVPLRSYQKYESADSEPDFEMLIKLANLFDVPTDFLLGRDDYLRKLEVFVDVPPEGPPRHPKPRMNR